MNRDDLVRHYITNYRPKRQREFSWFAAMPSLEEAIDRAARCKDSQGKHCPHQTRIKGAAIDAARTALSAKTDVLRGCKDFDALFEAVSEAISIIPGIGPLYIYDISTRIGAKQGTRPERVYLHAGTRTGARALGLDVEADTISTEALPPWLSVLPAYEIEDFLCIYKGDFEGETPKKLKGCGMPSESPEDPPSSDS